MHIEPDEPLDAETCEGDVEGRTDLEKGVLTNVSRAYRFYESSKLAIGEDEFKSDPDFWSSQFERDFEIIEERLTMEREALIRGKGLIEADLSGLQTPTFHWERVGGLRLVSFEQFILESNQGIFREDRFYCDKGRLWFKKTVLGLSEYGFPHVRKVEINGRWLLEVSKNPMGVI